MSTLQSPSGQPQQVKVWDRFVRFFHWSLLALVVTEYLSGEMGAESVHFPAGYLLLGLLLARVVWGFIGSHHARFSNFFYPPGVVLGYLREILSGHPRRYLGHNPAGSAMVFVILGLLLTLVGTGLVIEAVIEFEGPLRVLLFDMDDAFARNVRSIHVATVYALLFCVAAHLIGVVLASVQHRERLVLSMITGNKETLGNDA